MHLHRLWIALGLITACAVQAAVVYKWTDAAGVVHFSDQPVPGAEKIVTSSNSLNGMSATRGTATSSKSQAQAQPTALDYAVFKLDSPVAEQVFFNDELIPVRLSMTPELKARQSLTWNLNGAPLDEHANSLSFTLQSLPRGTYSIYATVTDGETNESKSSAAVTFYVRQPSELSPQHRR